MGRNRLTIDRAMVDDDEPVKKVTRAEWVSVGALTLSAGTMIFSFGAMWQDVLDHSRRIVKLEASNEILIQKVERIDANVAFLAELAREERGRSHGASR